MADTIPALPHDGRALLTSLCFFSVKFPMCKLGASSFAQLLLSGHLTCAGRELHGQFCCSIGHPYCKGYYVPGFLRAGLSRAQGPGDMCDGLQTSLVLWGKGTENEPGVGVGGLPAQLGP